VPTEAELQAVISTQAREIEQHRAAATQATIDMAIRDAVGTANIVPGSVDQFVQLARGDFSIVNGQVVDRQLKPASEAVKAKLAAPEFQHFLKTGPASTPTTASQRAPGPHAGFEGVPQSGGPRPLPDEGPGQFWLRCAQERQAAAPADSRLDMTKAFGLRGKK
jgi:hypothetical protein